MKLHDWLAEEPFTLSMSSGFFSFFAHAGMLAALGDQGLKPVKLTGSSAGALVGGCYASGASMAEVKQQLFSLQRQDFWDPGFGLGLLKGQLFRDQISRICQVTRIEDCPIPFKVSAFNLNHWKTDVIEEGCLTSAIAASCAFPFLFQPVALNGFRYLDGGIEDRPGLKGTQSGERILYHHINSRSPWRRKNSPALQIPVAKNMKSISMKALPRVGPNKLSKGVDAFECAYHETIELLQQPATEID